MPPKVITEGVSIRKSSRRSIKKVPFEESYPPTSRRSSSTSRARNSSQRGSSSSKVSREKDCAEDNGRGGTVAADFNLTPAPAAEIQHISLSISSVHSTDSAQTGATSRTTTSRRGGRAARSRAQASSMASARDGDSREYSSGRRYSGRGSRPPSSRANVTSPANPSSAAAAAAAAAKALRSNPHHDTFVRPTTSWAFDEGDHGRGSHSYHPFQSGRRVEDGGRTSWPVDSQKNDRRNHLEEERNWRNFDEGQHPQKEESVPQEKDGRQGSILRRVIAGPYMQRGGAHAESDDGQEERGKHYDSHPAHERYHYADDRGQYPSQHVRGFEHGREEDARRYGYDHAAYASQDARSEGYDTRRDREESGHPQPEDSQGHQQQPPRVMTPITTRVGSGRRKDYRAVGRGDDGSPSSSATARRSGGTSRVIGTPTPIHVPRASSGPKSPVDRRREEETPGTPASVFRGKPSGRSGTGRVAEEDDENSPQKILLSLRTPTSSYEERENFGGSHEDGATDSSKSKLRTKTRRGGGGAVHGAPPSPEEPPQIQHSHNHHKMSPSSLFFEPQRSPGPAGQGAGPPIEMAPSFPLFNPSFDSIADAHYLNLGLDSNFRTHSFGVGPPSGGHSSIHRTSSAGDGILPSQPSGGYQSHSSYIGRSGSNAGSIVLGMSPNNSFGNALLTASPKSGGTMILAESSGVQEPSSQSPRALYNSSSGGYSSGSGPSPNQQNAFRRRSGGLDQSKRTENGDASCRASPMSDGRKHTTGTTHLHPGSGVKSTVEDDEDFPSFYLVLTRYKRAFEKCSFLLPGLKSALQQPTKGSPRRPKKGNSSRDYGSPARTPERKYKGMEEKERAKLKGAPGYGLDSEKAEFMPEPSNTPTRPIKRFPDPSPTEIEIAMRRVNSAICAFGGTLGQNGMNDLHVAKDKSIFRSKEKPKKGQWQKSEAQIRYEEMMVDRYYENDNRLSWEFEESPPVETDGEDDEDSVDQSDEVSSEASTQKREGTSGEPDDENEPNVPRKKSKEREKTASSEEGIRDGAPGDKPDDENKTEESLKASEKSKMKYRCKLCGKPKQNHICRFQQSLQRSIGTMVYPAVNAFTSREPGMLAPALSEMNNFVSSSSEGTSSADSSPSRPTPQRYPLSMTQTSSGGYAPQHHAMGSISHHVTPETMRSAVYPHQPHQTHQMNSPGSSLSTGSGTPQGTPFRRAPGSSVRSASNINFTSRTSHQQTPGSGSSRRRRNYSQMSVGGGSSTDSSSDLLFVDAMELRPEQYRIVTPKKKKARGAYCYPPLPLPYTQRKHLSDNLFALSKQVPQLTDECAAVLREAREKDLWDLAVAQLMTQVIVVIHCPEGDNKLDGLRNYLMTLGIAC